MQLSSPYRKGVLPAGSLRLPYVREALAAYGRPIDGIYLTDAENPDTTAIPRDFNRQARREPEVDGKVNEGSNLGPGRRNLYRR